MEKIKELMNKVKELLSPRNLKFGGLFLGILIVVILLVSKFKIRENNIQKNGNVEKVNILTETDAIANSEGNEFGMFKDYLYKWQNGKIFLRSLTEEGTSYNMSLNIQNPMIESGDKYLFIGNKDDGIIYFLNNKAEMVERIPLNAPLFSMKQKNDSLVYQTKTGNMESIGIIDSNFNNVMKYTYDKETTLIYDYFPSKKKVAVAVLNVEEKTIGTRLDLYNNLTDKETLYFDGEIVLDLKYVNLGNLLVLTDNNLYYVSENDIVWKKEFPLIKDMKVNGNNIYVLYGNHLSVIDNKGEIKEDIVLSNQYNDIHLFESGIFSDEIIVYNDLELAILKKGEEFLKQNQEIMQIDTSQGTIFILDKDKYGFYKKDVKEVEVEEAE